MADSDIVILSGVRTAIGGFGGSLASVPPIELAATVAKEAMEAELGREIEVGEQYSVPISATSMRKEISGLVSAGDKTNRGLFLGVYGAGTTTYTGGVRSSSTRACTGEVWVRSSRPGSPST